MIQNVLVSGKYPGPTGELVEIPINKPETIAVDVGTEPVDVIDALQDVAEFQYGFHSVTNGFNILPSGMSLITVRECVDPDYTPGDRPLYYLDFYPAPNTPQEYDHIRVREELACPGANGNA